MSLRLLVISNRWPPMRGGGADYAFHFCRHLAVAGAEVDVVTRRSPGAVDDPALTVHPVMVDWSWRRLPRLIRLIDRIAPDVVNLHFMGRIYDHHPMVTFLPAVLKRRQPDLRFITLIEYASGVDHTRWSRATRLGHRWMARRFGWAGLDYPYGTLLRDSDAVIALCQSHREALVDRCSALDGRCHIVGPPPLMVMSQRSRPQARSIGRQHLGVDNSVLLMAYFGYIYPYKGLETLIEAAAILKRQAVSRPWKIGLLGGAADSYLRDLGRPHYIHELHALAEQHGVSDRLLWSGYLDNQTEELSNVLHALDACVLPFDSGVHLNNSSFAAAVAHGLPVITTRGRNTDPQFQHERNCILCPGRDARMLADQLMRVVHEPALRSRLETGATEMAKRWFSWDATIRAILSTGRLTPVPAAPH